MYISKLESCCNIKIYRTTQHNEMKKHTTSTTDMDWSPVCSISIKQRRFARCEWTQTWKKGNKTQDTVTHKRNTTEHEWNSETSSAVWTTSTSSFDNTTTRPPTQTSSWSALKSHKVRCIQNAPLSQIHRFICNVDNLHILHHSAWETSAQFVKHVTRVGSQCRHAYIGSCS